MKKLNAIAPCSVISAKHLGFATISMALSMMTVEIEPLQAATINFDSLPEIITPQFSQNGLTVTGSNDLFIGQTLLGDGLGIVGGNIGEAYPPGLVNSDQYIDNTESVLFSFNSAANKNVFIRFGTLLELPEAENIGTIEAFGVNGSSLGTIVLDSFSNSDFSISNLYDNASISAFSYSAAPGIGTIGRSVSFTPVPEPGAIASLALLGLGFIWKKKGSLSSRKISNPH